MEKFSIICPCCEANLTVDAQTGAILAHVEKKKVLGSFEDLKGELSKQKDLREQIFAQEMSSVKDRERLLEEKFQEALKRADKDTGEPFRNPLRLGPAAVGQVQPRRSPRQHRARRRRLPVAHQKQERALLRGLR